MTHYSPGDYGNFANDGAADYLAMLIAKLVATVTEVYADEERLVPDEDGESLFMPSIEVLALLCERYGAAPPRPATVRQWRDKYLALYDATIDRRRPRPSPEYRAGRRKAIEQTFRWLEGLTESHWES